MIAIEPVDADVTFLEARTACEAVLTWLDDGQPLVLHHMRRDASGEDWLDMPDRRISGTMVEHREDVERVWPAALRVIEAAVRAQPWMAEDVAAAIMPSLGGPVEAMRWIASLQADATA